MASKEQPVKHPEQLGQIAWLFVHPKDSTIPVLCGCLSMTEAQIYAGHVIYKQLVRQWFAARAPESEVFFTSRLVLQEVGKFRSVGWTAVLVSNMPDKAQVALAGVLNNGMRRNLYSILVEPEVILAESEERNLRRVY